MERHVNLPESGETALQVRNYLEMLRTSLGRSRAFRSVSGVNSADKAH
jgi:hypothetical protein